MVITDDFTKAYWKAVKNQVKVLVAKGKKKNEAYPMVIHELNRKIIAMADFAKEFVKPV